jgi:5'-nucleotidase
MNLLLTNDDGVYAKGLNALAELLAAKGHRITVVAPLTQYTAKGHGITLHRPLRLKLRKKKQNLTIYSLDGSPSDCVKIAVNHLMKKNPPDFVVSGVNHGFNLGYNVFYSGTVAAAIESYFLGINACALSVTRFNKDILAYAARLCDTVIRRSAKLKAKERVILNINIPPLECLGGVRITKLGKSLFLKEKIKRFKHPRRGHCLWLTGEKIKIGSNHGADVDARAIEKGYVSVTPLHVDLTDYCLMDTLKKSKWNHF